eukprot:1137411-Pelagomonas_calceolata.AAC.3
MPCPRARHKYSLHSNFQFAGKHPLHQLKFALLAVPFRLAEATAMAYMKVSNDTSRGIESLEFISAQAPPSQHQLSTWCLRLATYLW